MYGWRGRIGVIVPAVNSVMEPDFYKMAPKGVSIHFTRVSVHERSVKALFTMKKETRSAARLLASVKPNVIIFGCTSGSFVGGVGWDERITKEINEETGVCSIAATTAVISALRELGASRVSVVTPYLKKVNQKLVEFLTCSGFDVVNLESMGESITEPAEVANISPQEIYRVGKRTCLSQSDVLFISCTNFRGLDVVVQLEQDLEKPVITSNQASMWSALKKIGIRQALEGFGRLLSEVSNVK